MIIIYYYVVSEYCNIIINNYINLGTIISYIICPTLLIIFSSRFDLKTCQTDKVLRFYFISW